MIPSLLPVAIQAAPVPMAMGIVDDGTVTIVILEDSRYPGAKLRYTKFFPTRGDALWHINTLGLLPPTYCESLKTAELPGGVLEVMASVASPKTTLRSFFLQTFNAPGRN